MADEAAKKTIKAYVISTFKDAGTKKTFTKGSVVDIDEGAYGNYEAAELVRAPTPEETKAVKPAA
jgi:hypothetical protein